MGEREEKGPVTKAPGDKVLERAKLAEIEEREPQEITKGRFLGSKTEGELKGQYSLRNGHGIIHYRQCLMWYCFFYKAFMFEGE